MDRYWKEKRIKDLFDELKEEDKRLAPSFAKVWGAAASRGEKSHHPRRALRTAVAAATLIVVIGFAVIFYRQSSRPRTPPTAESAMLLSEWRSPTDFLLRSPKDQFMKTVPRLGESLFELKVITLQKN